MSRVGETGVGEMGIGETGVGEMGVGETGPNCSFDLKRTSIYTCTCTNGQIICDLYGTIISIFDNGYASSLPRNAGGRVRYEHLIRLAAMFLHV